MGTIILLFLFIFVLGYSIINILLKNEKLEEIIIEQNYLLEKNNIFINNLIDQIKTSNERLKEIDIKGTYSSDDEIGWFFSQLKQIQENLNNFTTDGKEENKNI